MCVLLSNKITRLIQKISSKMKKKITNDEKKMVEKKDHFFLLKKTQKKQSIFRSTKQQFHRYRPSTDFLFFF